MKAILYLGGKWISACIFQPNFRFGWNRYEICTQCCSAFLCFAKTGAGKAVRFQSCNWNYTFACTTSSYNIWTEKNALANAVYYVTKYIICKTFRNLKAANVERYLGTDYRKKRIYNLYNGVYLQLLQYWKKINLMNYFEYSPKHELHNFFLSQAISINKQF